MLKAAPFGLFVVQTPPQIGEAFPLGGKLRLQSGDPFAQNGRFVHGPRGFGSGSRRSEFEHPRQFGGVDAEAPVRLPLRRETAVLDRRAYGGLAHSRLACGPRKREFHCPSKAFGAVLCVLLERGSDPFGLGTQPAIRSGGESRGEK